MYGVRTALSPFQLSDGRRRDAIKRTRRRRLSHRSRLRARRSVFRMVVNPSVTNPRRGNLRFGTDFGVSFPVSFGRSGVGYKHAEGDGVTPIGRYVVRGVLYRSDRVKRPQTGVPCFALEEGDWWCDLPHPKLYNRFVRTFGEGLGKGTDTQELLMRDDDLYDLIVVLSYNDLPPQMRRGSAIFMHVARGDYEPTAGCIGMAKKDLELVVSRLRGLSFVDIQTAQMRACLS